LRDLLTGLAILLLVCLTGALVAPHLIDWNSRRGQIAGWIETATGQKVSIEGPVAVELLPTPVLKLSHVRFEGDGKLRGQIGRFRMKLALPPLLRGEIRITQALLQGADIAIRTEEGGAGPGLPAAGGLLASVGLERLGITESRFRLIGRDGVESFAAERVEGLVDATSLLGPYRGSVVFGVAGDRRTLRFSTARIDADVLRLKALLEHEGAAARAEYDGMLRWGSGPLQLEGALAANGNAAFVVDGRVGQVIWRAAAKVKSEGARAALDGIELAFGNTERQTVFTGNGDIDLSREGALALTLSTQQLDLDRLLAGEESRLALSPERLLMSVAQGLSGAGGKPLLSGDIDLSVGSLLVGGDVVVGPRVVLRGRDGRIALERLSGELPGRTEAKFEGAGVADGSVVAGRMTLETRDLAKLSGWFHGTPARPLAVRVLKLEGDLRQSATETSISRALLVADDMRLEGSLTLDSAPSRPKLTMRLTADQLDVLKVPEIPEGDAAGVWDLDLQVDARRVRYRGVGAGNIALRLRKEGGAAHLDELRIKDLDGANLTASGRLDGVSPKLDARLQATRVEAILQLADRLSTHWGAPLLASRAASLAPADLTITWAPDPANITLRRATAVGRLGVTEIDAAARLTPAGDLAGPDTLSVTLKSPSPSSLFRQIGLDAIPIAAAGAVDLKLSGGGVSARTPVADWSLRGALAGLAVDMAAKQTTNPAEPYTGRVRLSSPDLSPLAQTLLIAVPAVTPGQRFVLDAGFDLRGYRITLRDFDMRSGGNQVKGEIAFNLAEFGRVSGQLRAGQLDASAIAPLIFGEAPVDAVDAGWGKAAFGNPAAITLPGDLWIEADSVVLGRGLIINRPKFVLRFDSGLIFIEHAEGQWLNGALRAQATLRRNNRSVSFTGRFGLEGWHLDSMALQTAAGPLKGRASAQVDVSAIGDSPLALIAALSGNGRLDLMNAEVTGLAHGALDGLLKTGPLDFAAVTRQALTDDLQRRLQGSMVLPSGQTPLAIGAGVLRAGPLRFAGKAEEITTGLALDFKDMTLSARTALMAREQPKHWSGPPPSAEVLLRGPMRNPVREIDVSGLANGLTAIAIQRETERIEVLEQDQRERGFFNRQLRASEEQRRAEDEEKRKQEAARRALEEQKRREEAQRREAQRQQGTQPKPEEFPATAPTGGIGGSPPAPPGAPLRITPPAR
jgi:AsmA family/AsmA-like C-terminal region